MLFQIREMQGSKTKKADEKLKKCNSFLPPKPISKVLYPQHPRFLGALPVFTLLELQPTHGNMYLCKPLGN